MNTFMAKMVGAAYTGVLAMGLAACQTQKSVLLAANANQRARENSRKRK